MNFPHLREAAEAAPSRSVLGMRLQESGHWKLKTKNETAV